MDDAAILERASGVRDPAAGEAPEEPQDTGTTTQSPKLVPDRHIDRRKGWDLCLA